MLIQFLTVLPEPIIPLNVTEWALNCVTLEECKRLAVTSLPPVHFHVFFYVLSFLRHLVHSNPKLHMSTMRQCGK
jgi:hypothetical protein